MAPRTHITAVSQRPTDQSFCFFVRHFVAGKRGVWILWTDSRQYAESFAAKHVCYGKPALVEVRDGWAKHRAIGFSEDCVRVK